MPGPAFHAATATTVSIGGRTLVAFAGCNYLGLAQHPAVLAAAAAAIGRFGLSTSASRRTTGHTEVHAALERDIVRLLRCDDALLLPDGYTANLAALQGLAAIGMRHALIDERAHRSLTDAARLAGLQVSTYRHADPHDARSARAHADGPCVILTDGVFTTDGRLAPLPELADIDAVLLVDDCHGFGVVGDRGAGTPTLLGLESSPRLLVTSTLAKGVGCAGGFVAGPADLVAAVHDHAAIFIGTTPTAPPLIAAAIEALRITSTDDALHRQLRHNIDAVREILASHGLPAHSDPTPIFAFTPPLPDRVAAALDDAGVFIPLIDYPQGPAPRFFRLSVSARHTPSDLDLLDAALAAAIGPASRRVPSEHA